jgi:hypothetical protein
MRTANGRISIEPSSTRPLYVTALRGIANPRRMLTNALSKLGLRSWHIHAGALGSIYLCIGLWIRAKTVDQEERGNAERRALFVGCGRPCSG